MGGVSPGFPNIIQSNSPAASERPMRNIRGEVAVLWSGGGLDGGSAGVKEGNREMIVRRNEWRESE